MGDATGGGDVDIDSWRRKYRIHLETPRLLLRPLIMEDQGWLAVLFADPEVNRFLLDSACTPKQASRFAEAVVSLDLMRHRFGLWAIEDKTTGIVHGWTELSKLRPWSGPSDEIALSYVLGVESWGRGIATEAAGRLLRHAFEVLGEDRLMAVIMADNAASRRVLEKLGMRSIGNPVAPEMNLEYFQIGLPIEAESHAV
jgi:RimJ/RimL family protein N-acetyltransferase